MFYEVLDVVGGFPEDSQGSFWAGPERMNSFPTVPSHCKELSGISLQIVRTQYIH